MSKSFVTLVIAILLTSLLGYAPPATSQLWSLIADRGNARFEDVTEQVGINAVVQDSDNPEASGRWGVIAVGDYVGDGWDDVLLNTYPNLHLYHNNRNGTFTEVPNVFPEDFYLRTAIWCDIERSGVEDLLLGAVGEDTLRNVWLHNNRNGTFTEITPRAVAQDAPSPTQAMTCADIAHTGWLDVLQADQSNPTNTPLQNRVWMNYGMQFRDEARARGFLGGTTNNPYGLQCADIGGNGYPTCLGTGNDYNWWFLAKGDGTVRQDDGGYENFAFLSPYLTDGQFADFNGSGRIGAAVADTFTIPGNSILHVHCNVGNFDWRPIVLHGLQECWRYRGNFDHYSPRAIAVGDFDNSGAPSIFMTLGGDPAGVGRHLLFMNDGRGNFDEMGLAAGIAGPGAQKGTGGGGVAVIDYDMDGHLDLIVGYNEAYSPGPFRVWRNVTRNNNSWVGFILRAPLTVGTWVAVTACGKRQVQQLTARTGWLHQDSRNVHFGLGACHDHPQVTILWPDGRVVSRTVPARRYYIVTPTSFQEFQR